MGLLILSSFASCIICIGLLFFLLCHESLLKRCTLPEFELLRIFAKGETKDITWYRLNSETERSAGYSAFSPLGIPWKACLGLDIAEYIMGKDFRRKILFCLPCFSLFHRVNERRLVWSGEHKKI